MKYQLHSFKDARVILENDPAYLGLWEDITEVIESITDQDLIDGYNSLKRKKKKSLSEPINDLIDKRLVQKGWNRQSPIFVESKYQKGKETRWTLDFSKNLIAVEVAFNHGEAAAWNLLKPVLSSQLNHVEKAIQTSAGVIITATNDLKRKGNFDNSVGTYEKYLDYLRPFSNILNVPLIIMGLESPESFYITPCEGDIPPKISMNFGFQSKLEEKYNTRS
jgi:Restriction endonuclease BglII.